MTGREFFVLPEKTLPHTIAQDRDLLHLDLQDAAKFSSFLRDKGFSSYSRDDLRMLWWMGVLQADLVASPRGRLKRGFRMVVRDPWGQYLLADLRRVAERRSGWGSAAKRFGEIPTDVEPYFHPFRLFVVYQIDRVLGRSAVHPLQFLWSKHGGVNVARRHFRSLQEWSQGRDFAALVQEWNDTATLAIASEPCASEAFGYFRSPADRDMETQKRFIASRLDRLRECYTAIGVKKIDDVRQRLCGAAEELDPNKVVYIAFRLSTGDAHLRLEGKLGAGATLKVMAEALRRVAEETFGVELREEDEMRFGMPMADSKRRLYGSPRLFDGDRGVAREYLHFAGLDSGLLLRWYVEGDTEAEALQTYFGLSPAVSVVNLRGQVAEKGSVLKFRDSLQHDLTTRVFSFVSVDGDRDDARRAVDKAIEDDLICGLVFRSDPDFEFANFAVGELEAILWRVACERGASETARARLHAALDGIESAKDLDAAASCAVPELNRVVKSAGWGCVLMKYAAENPEWEPAGVRGPRPIIEGFRAAEQTVRADHGRMRREFRVDPKTGRFVKRVPEGQGQELV